MGQQKVYKPGAYRSSEYSTDFWQAYLLETPKCSHCYFYYTNEYTHPNHGFFASSRVSQNITDSPFHVGRYSLVASLGRINAVRSEKNSEILAQSVIFGIILSRYGMVWYGMVIRAKNQSSTGSIKHMTIERG
jgi:hypothetical protein